MPHFQIAYSASQQVVGIFEGETGQEAIEAYAKDAGYGSYSALASATGTDPEDTSDLIVTEVTQLQRAIAGAIADFRSDDDGAETLVLNVSRDEGVWDVVLSDDDDHAHTHTILQHGIDATQSDAELAGEIEGIIEASWDEEWDEDCAPAEDEDED